MNWLFKLWGHHDREYRGVGFTVRIIPKFRELVSVVHTSDGVSLELSAERIGRKLEVIGIDIPRDVEDRKVSQIVQDLEAALRAMSYDYEITRSLGFEDVPESEQEAAIAELREMGYELDFSDDKKQIRQRRIPGTPTVSLETARRQAARMATLLQSVHGKRYRREVLAKSRDA